ncbi:MAG: polyprenyl diphosphate synthase [Rhodobacteraceae bacterium]|nr:polyprenyl diphosphate synthase [Paracoccaceae bacterium]
MFETAPGDDNEVPRSVAIIMDGNGRWAVRRGMERIRGHVRGAARVREILTASLDAGIEYLTLFAFSTENSKRSEEEVAALMGLFDKYIRSEARQLVDAGIRVRFIGDLFRLDRRLQELARWLERETEHNSRLNLTVALYYGARDEITRAVRRIAVAVQEGELDPDSVSEKTISSFLDTAEVPDPDLVIRTSGEMRLSNFLLWQSAYAEFAFVKTEWPDFSADMFHSVLDQYGRRERRFGRIAGVTA